MASRPTSRSAMQSPTPRRCCQPQATHTLVAGLLGALVAGFIYAYSSYSNALQQAFNLSETEKENIGLAPNLANMLTVTNGMIIDHTSVSTGVMLGGVIMAASYGLYGAIALKHITVSNPALAFFFLFAAGVYGASFMICATYTVLAKNFKTNRSAGASILPPALLPSLLLPPLLLPPLLLCFCCPHHCCFCCFCCWCCYCCQAPNAATTLASSCSVSLASANSSSQPCATTSANQLCATSSNSAPAAPCNKANGRPTLMPNKRTRRAWRKRWGLA